MSGQEPAPPSATGKALTIVFAAFLGLTMVLVLLSIPAGLYTVLSGRLSSTVGPGTFLRPYLWVGPVVAFLPAVFSAGSWFVILTAIYSAMLGYMLWQTRRPLAAILASVREGPASLFSSPFLVAMISIGFLAFTASIIDQSTAAAGVPIGGVKGDPLRLFVGFTTSPLTEEFGFRVVLIGSIALILSLGRGWKSGVNALWRPSSAVEGAAVGSGATLLIWAATGFSAMTFGACHVVCGNTWDIGKLPEATYGGIVLGYLYVRYGFHVAVIAHWGIDYFGSVYSFFGQAAYGIAWNSAKSEYFLQSLVDYDLLFLFGLASFLLVTYVGLKKYLAGKAKVSPDAFRTDKGEAGGEGAQA
jgi:hypothetical protein